MVTLRLTLCMSVSLTVRLALVTTSGTSSWVLRASSTATGASLTAVTVTVTRPTSVRSPSETV